MRPRSRLLSKRRLPLPTIREGTEETVRDLNEANTLHIAGHGQAVSSEDYLLSICHLASPTFTARHISPDHIHTRKEIKLNGKLMIGSSDPLEYLYGHQNNLSGGVRGAFAEEKFIRQHGSLWEGQAHSRAHSIPHASSPDLPFQRKSSCPELHTSTNTSIFNISPKHSFSSVETRRGSPADRGAEGKRQSPTIKQSLISQWLSDCRSAWREARVRACMLPAINEI
uniref:Uncharacterized protein n=1 Tax=Cyclopterus lumpus TaxID=8103 RepID=A0A8C3G479_CYCLU